MVLKSSAYPASSGAFQRHSISGIFDPEHPADQASNFAAIEVGLRVAVVEAQSRIPGFHGVHSMTLIANSLPERLVLVLQLFHKSVVVVQRLQLRLKPNMTT